MGGEQGTQSSLPTVPSTCPGSGCGPGPSTLAHPERERSRGSRPWAQPGLYSRLRHALKGCFIPAAAAGSWPGWPWRAAAERNLGLKKKKKTNTKPNRGRQEPETSVP